MSAVTPLQASFNGGELSRRMDGRVDQSVRSIALRTMLGYLPLMQGPAEAAPGTVFVAKCKGNSIPIPFEFNVTQSYVIEAGAQYFRFYTNDARIETAPGVAYEIGTPYNFAQVQELYWEQSADVLYLFHPSIAPRKLLRTSADTFSLQEISFREGPFEPRNWDKDVTMQADGLTGDVTVTASDAIFASGDVGGLVEIEGGDFSAIPMWEPGISRLSGDMCQWNGNVYACVSGGRSGTVAPIHAEGAEWDGSSTGTDINNKGPYGVQWEYKYDRFGLIRLTAFVSPSEMSATVLRHMPTTDACWRWRFGAFSARRGYPSTGALWQDRLVLAKGANIYGSVSGDLENHAYRNELGDISRDMAFSQPLPNPNYVRWLASDQQLIAATPRAGHVLTAASAGSGAGPGNIDVGTPGSRGTAAIKPFLWEGRIVHVRRDRRRLLQMVYDSNRLLRQESGDLSRFADHISSEGIKGLAWQAMPETLIWIVLDSGQLAVCAYNPDELLLGWARRDMAAGLTVQNICCITDPSGELDQLWLTVRVGNESWMLRMAPIRASNDDGIYGVMSDASVIREGETTVNVTVPHLAGKQVEVVADGKVHPMITLDSTGAGVLEYPAAHIIIGLPFAAEIETLPPEAGAANGTAQMKVKRITHVGIRVVASDGLRVESGGVSVQVEQQIGDLVGDQAIPLFTGDVMMELTGRDERSPTVRVRRTLPRPSTICAVVTRMQTGDR